MERCKGSELFELTGGLILNFAECYIALLIEHRKEFRDPFLGLFHGFEFFREMVHKIETDFTYAGGSIDEQPGPASEKIEFDIDITFF